MTTGQLSIFDALAQIDAEANGQVITCPHCHVSWTGPAVVRTEKHYEVSPECWSGPIPTVARCSNQAIMLWRIAIQADMSPDRPTFRTDFLGAILHAKHRGCTDQQIAAVLRQTKGQS